MTTVECVDKSFVSTSLQGCFGGQSYLINCYVLDKDTDIPGTIGQSSVAVIC